MSKETFDDIQIWFIDERKGMKIIGKDDAIEVLQMIYDYDVDYVVSVDDDDIKIIKNHFKDELPGGVSFVDTNLDENVFIFDIDQGDDPRYIIFDENKFKWVVELVEKANSDSKNIKEKLSVFFKDIDLYAEALGERAKDAIYNELTKRLETKIQKVLNKIPNPPRPLFLMMYFLGIYPL